MDVDQTHDQKALLDILFNTELDTAGMVAVMRRLSVDSIHADMLSYAVDLFRQHMIPVQTDIPHLVDLCGTGGDRSGSFNVSTTAAFIVAGAGCKVAKHGNISITSKSGSIDLLRALGVHICETPDEAHNNLDNYGIAFLFAPHFHPVFKKFSEARSALAQEGVRTIFNIMGPLLNPARVTRSAIGVFSEALVPIVAETLGRTGSYKAIVFHGDHMDELTLSGINKIAETNEGKLQSYDLNARDLGFSSCSPDDLAGGTPDDNAVITRSILKNEIAGPKKDIVLLNAAAAIYVARDGISLNHALAIANESLISGNAADIMERMSR